MARKREAASAGVLLENDVDEVDNVASAQTLRRKGETRSIKCQLRKVVRLPTHIDRILDAVERVNEATLLASELLNLHLRRCLDAEDASGIARIFDANWTKQAWIAVSSSRGRVDAPLAASRAAQIALHTDHRVVDATGVDQIFKAEADKFVATASTNVHLHFRARVERLVRASFHLSKDEFSELSTEERAERGKQLKKIAWDVCRIGGNGGEQPKSDSRFHAWVDGHRRLLGLEDLEWKTRPIEYHLKANPARFLIASWRILRALEAHGRRGFALLPLRRSLSPGYITIDTWALRRLLRLGTPASTRERTKANALKRQKLAPGDLERQKRAARLSPEAAAPDKWESWDAALDLSAVLRRELCGLTPTNSSAADGPQASERDVTR